MAKPTRDFIPNSTQTPNVIFDMLMPLLHPADFKLVLFVCRKTYGWRKDKDRISITQFEAGTGLSHKWIIQRLRGLVDVGLLIRTDSTKGSIWSLNLTCDMDKVVYSLHQPAYRTGVLSPVDSVPERGVLSTPTKLTKTKDKDLSLAGNGAKPSEDERHKPLERELCALWQTHNGGAVAPWGGRCGAELKKMLQSVRSWPLTDLIRCARNTFSSDEFYKRQPLHKIAADLPTFLTGPKRRLQNGVVNEPTSRGISMKELAMELRPPAVTQ